MTYPKVASYLCPLASPSLLPCPQEYVLSPATRRKLSVHIEGNRAAVPSTAAAAADDNEPANEPAPGAARSAAAEENGSAAAASEAAAAGGAGEEGQGEQGSGVAGKAPAVELISDIFAFKRRQELFPSLK